MYVRLVPKIEQKKMIEFKQKKVEDLKVAVQKQQEDLEVLELEKVIQQDEYSALSSEWKRKQEVVCSVLVNDNEQIIQLNRKLIRLNQEYNALRQRYVQRQEERSERRNQAYVLFSFIIQVVEKGTRKDG